MTSTSFRLELAGARDDVVAPEQLVGGLDHLCLVLGRSAVPRLPRHDLVVAGVDLALRRIGRVCVGAEAGPVDERQVLLGVRKVGGQMRDRRFALGRSDEHGRAGVDDAADELGALCRARRVATKPPCGVPQKLALGMPKWSWRRPLEAVRPVSRGEGGVSREASQRLCPWMPTAVIFHPRPVSREPGPGERAVGDGRVQHDQSRQVRQWDWRCRAVAQADAVGEGEDLEHWELQLSGGRGEKRSL